MNGPGDRAAFEAAVDALKPRLHEDDLLFIHTNNHGDNFGSGSFLSTYPSWGEYFADDFAAKLGELPRYQSLIVMMEQCNSGGFNQPIIKHSTAHATSVASAAIATQSSYASPDGHWDSFARDWFAAQAGHDPYGAALAFNPDTNADGKIEATEAFNYANAVRNPSDSPQFDESSAAGGNDLAGPQYIVWWWWCWILREVLERPYRRTARSGVLRAAARDPAGTGQAGRRARRPVGRPAQGDDRHGQRPSCPRLRRRAVSWPRRGSAFAGSAPGSAGPLSIRIRPKGPPSIVDQDPPRGLAVHC